MKKLVMIALMLSLAGCTPGVPENGGMAEPAALRGFGIDVDQAISARVPTVHLKTCGAWGCHEQDVALSIAGPTTTAPCGSPSSGPDAAVCGPIHLPGPGPGFGYAPVPDLTVDPVTVTITTPPGAPLVINGELRVTPQVVCPNAHAGAEACASGAAQAQLRIAADGSLSQTR